jgi:hypothetical protein
MNTTNGCKKKNREEKACGVVSILERGGDAYIA